MGRPHVPPQNVEAEQAVLGGCLLDNQAIYAAVEHIGPDDFYKGAHRLLFEAVINLSERGEAVDILTVTDLLRKTGELDMAGGAAYIAALPESVPTTANVAAHARIVKEKALLRKLINTASHLVSQGYEGSQDVDELLDEAERTIFEVNQDRERRAFTSVKDALKDSFKTIERLYEERNPVTGVTTGFHELDKITSGLQPGDLVIVAGRPSMGKTTLAVGFAENAATMANDPTPCAIFSLEMSTDSLVMRMLCSQARVDSWKLRGGYASQRDLDNLVRAADRLSQAPIFIDDTPAQTVLEVRAKARRLKSEKNIGLILVDYLQLMRGRTSESREREISEISRGLKSLAKELSVPVVALSQLNRGVESRPDKRPMLSDLRECVVGDTLVQLADGRRVPIRDLVGSEPEVLAVGDDGKITVAHSDKVWRVGTRPVFDVVLASGRRVRCTGRHRLMTGSGWKRVENLAVGDRIATAREIPEPSETHVWPDRRVALLGQLIGDGSYLSGQPMRYTTESEENSRIVQEAAEAEFGCEVKRYSGRRRWHQLLISGNGNRWHPAGVNAWLRDLGIFGQRSHQKRVPVEAFRLERRQIALLLGHLWATDGCISLRKQGARGERGSIFYSTNSVGLARDVAALLLRIGIVGRISRVQQGEHRPSYHVRVSGADAQRRFLDIVPLVGPRRLPGEVLRALLADRVANTNVDTLPIEVFDRAKASMSAQGISQRAMVALRGTSYGGASHFRFAPSRSVAADYASHLDDDVLRAAAEADLFWDRLVAIEPAGEEEVFDLTVPGPASWLADGIVSHNSGAIEQDADVIMFIYRDEVYNKETPDKGIAEVIVGKQRNGPIGKVHLRFFGEHTRFENLASDG